MSVIHQHRPYDPLTLVSRAQSADIGFVHKIRNSTFYGEIHSIFDRTINIRCQQNNELYTIANHAVDNAPNTLIIHINRFSELGLQVNDRVYVENQIVRIGNKLAVLTGKIKVWQSTLPKFPVEVERLRSNLSAAKDFVELHGARGGILKPLDTSNSLQVEVSRLLEVHSNSLLHELSLGNMNNARDHAKRLIGLGPGLTPSGDDFLVGLFTAFNLQNIPYSEYRTFCKDTLSGAESLTNEISYFALRKAASGQVRESIITFLNSVLFGSNEDTTLHVSLVLKIGSSSGTDIALGLLKGLELIVEQLEVRYGDKSCY